MARPKKEKRFRDPVTGIYQKRSGHPAVQREPELSEEDERLVDELYEEDAKQNWENDGTSKRTERRKKQQAREENAAKSNILHFFSYIRKANNPMPTQQEEGETDDDDDGGDIGDISFEG
jgi:hypothetical protein